MKSYISIILLFMAITVVSQDYRNIFIGRYVGIAKQTSASASGYDYNSVGEFQYGDSVNQFVSFFDSTTWASGWNGATGIQQAWPDSTVRDWGAPNHIYGHLYNNDSLYYKWNVFTPPSNVITEEFFGFKLYSTVGVNDLSKQENELLISPQPAADIMYIQSTQLMFRQEDITIIYDITGKQYTIPMQYINKNTYKLDVSSLRAGMYVVVIKTEKGVVRKKVIVE